MCLSLLTCLKDILNRLINSSTKDMYWHVSRLKFIENQLLSLIKWNKSIDN